MMGKSVICATEQYIESCSLFAIICGFPSTKKSVCMDWLKDAHLEASKAVDLIINKDDPFANAPYTNNSKKNIYRIA